MTRQDAPGLLALAAALAWLAWVAPEFVAAARTHIESGDPGSVLRLGLALLPLSLAVALPGLEARFPGRALSTSLWIAGGALMLAAVDASAHAAINPDELYHLHVAWLIGDGMVPFRDFFLQQNVLWYVLAAPFMHLFQDHLVVVQLARLSNLLFTAGTILLAARIVRRYHRLDASTGIFLLAMSGFLTTAFEVRPDPLGNLLLMASLDAVLAGSSAWGGLWSGLAILATLKSTIPAALIGLGTCRGEKPLRQAIRFGAATTACVLFEWAVLAVLGAWHDYWLGAYTFNVVFLRLHSGEPLFPSITTFWLHQHVVEDPLLLALVPLGVVVLLRRREWLIPMAAVLTIGFAIQSRLGHPQYTLFQMSMLGILAAAALPAEQGSERRLLHGAPLGMSVLLVAFMSLLGVAAHPYGGFDLSGPQTALAHVRPGETYYGPEGPGMMRHPVFRRDAGFYPCLWARTPHDLLTSGLVALPRPLEPDLVAHPPDAIVLSDPSERERILRELARHGMHYQDVGHDVWALLQARRSR
ncbi:MAG: ArnT family glycosyltransferase [Candidatus Xenobia bacterium]